MKKVKDTGDVRVVVEQNFDSDEFVDALGKGFVKRAMKASGDALLHIVKKRFYTSKGPDKFKWPPLSPITKKFKGHSKKLFLTGRLQNSFKIVNDGNGKVQVVTNVPYARVQNKGVKFRSKFKQTFWMWINLFRRKGGIPRSFRITIPGRPFMGVDKEVKSVTEALIIKELKKAERLGKYAL